MTKKRGHLIAAVEPGSAAAELGIRAGDRLLSVNGREIRDVFDYRFQIASDDITLLILKDGEEWEYEIENGGADPGLVFENGLMSEYRSCRNRCIFCFIDQMPKGMRSTLYFKDDDSRLSFLQGNYVTLTNMGEADIRQIIDYRMEPINISVHTTNPGLRCRMLRNRFAGEKLKYLDRLKEAGIGMNGQIVLCRGWNDGPELKRTIRDLMKYAPVMKSVSVVPVGLTDYRDGLCPLEPLTAADAGAAIDVIESFQREAFEKFGLHFVHASDEFYLLAGRKLPEEARYDGYPQLENGVGMLRLLHTEVGKALRKAGRAFDKQMTALRPEKLSAVSGALASPFMERELKRIERKFPEKQIFHYTALNHFFGEKITVTGLLTGQDLVNALKGQDLGERLLLPQNLFRNGEEVFLDDMTKSDLERELGVRCVILGPTGEDLVNAVLDPLYRHDPEHGAYELPGGGDSSTEGAEKHE